MKTDFDIIIIGAGLVGLSAALACAQSGAHIALIDANDPEATLDKSFDGRASALSAGSYHMLGHLGVRETLAKHFTPILDMKIADSAMGKPSPLELHFNAQETSGSLGYMIENRHLRAGLLCGVAEHENIELIAPTTAEHIDRAAGHVQVNLPHQTLRAALLIAADGRASPLRKAAQIKTTFKDYGQKALVTSFRHERPHGSTAYQFFYSGGPLALLPLSQNRMSIVWSDTGAAIDAANALDDAAFVAELKRRMNGLLGKISLCAPRQTFPLGLQMAAHYTDTRLALIGDAAHIIHPIAGQGLNMGLRDVAALSEVIAQARSRGLDIGGASLDDYAVWRNFDNRLLSSATDIFNSLFSNNISPLRHGRRLALSALNLMPATKGQLINAANGQSGQTPRLLQP